MKEFIEKRNLTGKIKVTMEGRGVWQGRKEEIVSIIKDVVEDFQRQSFTLTLRQLYYQLVKRNAIPNHDSVYKKLSAILDDCRYAGVIDWSAIEDRGRVPYIPTSFDDIPEFLRNAKYWYERNKQEGQETHLEIWTEKDAISGILRRVSGPYHVRLVVNKGYTSSTAAYDSYQRFASALSHGQKVVILYFGDHDPSGLDMIRDIRERCLNFLINGKERRYFDGAKLDWAVKIDCYYEYHGANYVDTGKLEEKFGACDWWEKCFFMAEYGEKEFSEIDCFIYANFEVVPIGLTMEQIREFAPPPNPAKITDPRAKWYIKEFGQKSWEVDALNPESMIRIVTEKILQYMDSEKYEAVIALETTEREKIVELIDSLPED